MKRTTPQQASRKLVCTSLVPTVIASVLAALSVESARAHPDKFSDETVDVRVVVCTKNISSGALVNENAVKTISVKQAKRPNDAVYDPFIVVGRRTEKSLQKGDPVRFQDIFSKELLRKSNTKYVEKLQGLFPESLYIEKTNRDPKRLIPIVRSLHDIPTGAVVLPEDLTIGKIEEEKCPGDAIGDIWIAAGRVTTYPIKAHEIVYYYQVLPLAIWQRWKDGTFKFGD